MDLSGTCWSCGTVLAASEYGRRESCSGCGEDTKSCKNCMHYAPGLNNDCREPVAEAVFDKAAANFCEFFKPGSPKSSGAKKASGEASAKSAFDALFKKKPR